LVTRLHTQLNIKANGLRAADAKAISEMLKANKSLTMLDLSDNEIGAWMSRGASTWDPDELTLTPEGPAALADALKVNSSVTSVSQNVQSCCALYALRFCFNFLLVSLSPLSVQSFVLNPIVFDLPVQRLSQRCLK
jgi:hypothetical protein